MFALFARCKTPAKGRGPENPMRPRLRGIRRRQYLRPPARGAAPGRVHMEANFLSKQIETFQSELDGADAVLIGAGAGLSASAGLTYTGERFARYFADFRDKFGITDIYSGGFYPFADAQTYWAWWSRHIYYNRYAQPPLTVYRELLSFVQKKNYFVLTTNVDHCFQNACFAKERLFYTQGDYGLFQCSVPCHDRTYDNRESVLRMVREQRDMKIPAELIPRCPVCGREMTVNLRADDTFVQDSGWYAAYARYEDFLHQNADRRILLLELGVGFNTPGIIKYPFWQIAMRNPRARYVCINRGEAAVPDQIRRHTLCIDGDIGSFLAAAKRA